MDVISCYFRKSILSFVLISFVSVNMFQFTVNELEESYNSSTTSENYIDFDGDSVFDLEDDFEGGESDGKKTKWTLLVFYLELRFQFNSFSRDLFDYYKALNGMNYLSRLFKPPKSN